MGRSKLRFSTRGSDFIHLPTQAATCRTSTSLLLSRALVQRKVSPLPTRPEKRNCVESKEIHTKHNFCPSPCLPTNTRGNGISNQPCVSFSLASLQLSQPNPNCLFQAAVTLFLKRVGLPAEALNLSLFMN